MPFRGGRRNPEPARRSRARVMVLNRVFCLWVFFPPFLRLILITAVAAGGKAQALPVCCGTQGPEGMGSGQGSPCSGKNCLLFCERCFLMLTISSVLVMVERVGRQRFPEVITRSTAITIPLSAPAPNCLLFSHRVSFHLAFILFLFNFCSELGRLVLKIEMLSFASCSSSRFSKSSEWCIKSLWHETRWTRSSFPHGCFYCLCPHMTVVAEPHLPLRMQPPVVFLCCRRGTKGCRRAGGEGRASLIPPC